MGWIVSVSGSDGSGKTTLIERLKERVESNGKPVHFIRLRLGFTPVITWLKTIAGVNESNLSVSDDPQSEYSQSKKPAWKKIVTNGYRLFSLLDLSLSFFWIAVLRSLGKDIITERYFWDNQVLYQDKFGKPDGVAKVLWGILRRAARVPDAAFYLHLPPEESYRRVMERNQGREEESLEILARRSQMYENLPRSEWVMIDAMEPPDRVVEQVYAELEKRINNF